MSDMVLQKIERWKCELLDTGKRNKMINYRETKRATLRILEPEATDLFNRLALSDKQLTFKKPMNKDADLRTYSVIALMETLSYTLNVQVGDIKTVGTIIEREKTLKNLRSKAKLAQEEQGTNILYLCFGFIYWRAQNRDSSPWFKAPLLMMPVTLGLKSLNAPYTLSRYDDEIEVNPTLDYLFNTEYNIDLPKFELKNKDSFDDYLTQIEEIVDKRGWKVVREVSLGLLSFLKISMYHDLENNRERMVNHPVLKAIAGGRKALGELPAEAENFDFDAVKPDEWHEVVDSDSSQEEAILFSKLGVSFVMQGPPGTGKSQTITNIIAEALADGKKVLFVSEKAAALEVVLKRLTEVHLDDFCLSLHNYKANKKEIIDSIGANLNLEPEYIDRSVMNELTELFHDRWFLTKYADDLHRVIEPLGESVYMVFGKLSKLEKASVISFQIENRTSITREQYSSLLYVLDALEKALRNLGGTLDSNPWHGTIEKSSGQVFKQQMIRETEGLSDKLRELDSKVKAFNEEYQSAIGQTWDKVTEDIADLIETLALPLFPYWWTDLAKQETLINRIRREAVEQKSLVAPMQRIRESFLDAVFDAPLDDWMKRVRGILDTYENVGYTKAEAGENYLTGAILKTEEVKALLADLEAFSAQYKSVAERLGLSKTDSLENAKTANAVLSRLARRPEFHERVWYSNQNNGTALELVGIAEGHASSLNKLSSELYCAWTDTVRDLDLAAIHSRLFEEYPWMYNELAEGDIARVALAAHTSKAKELLQKITTLVEAHTKALGALGVTSEDSLDGLLSISALLRQASEVPYLETAWFDIRRDEAAKPLLAEACENYKKIAELKEKILKKWEPEALNMEDEAIAMLGRFKTEHIGAFHRMKAGFKADIKTIKLLLKEVGRTIDESEAIAFLQSLKEIRDENQWYKEKQEQLRELAGSYYRGADTDWDAVKTGMVLAAEIANSFSYGNIPEDVIAAIQRSASSIQSAAEIKALATVLSHDNVKEAEFLLAEASYVENAGPDASLRDLVIPQITMFLEVCAAQDELISALQAKFISPDPISGKDINMLLTNVRQLQIEEEWFIGNQEKLARLFSTKNQGADSDFESIAKGLLFAKEILTFFSDNIPEGLISVLCAEIIPEENLSDRNWLSVEAIASLVQKLNLLAPYIYRATASVSEYTGPKLFKWLTATGILASLESEIQPVRFSDEVTLEQSIAALPVAIQTRDLRNQILNQEIEVAAEIGERYKGIDTDWVAIEKDILTVTDFLGKLKPAVSWNFLEIICDSEVRKAKAIEAISELQRIHLSALDAFSAFAGYFEEAESLGGVELSALAERYDNCLNGFGELNKWLDYVEARADCDLKGLSSFTEAIARKNNTISDVCNAFERGFYAQWLSGVIDSVPAVESFRRRVHEQRSERFVKLDTIQHKIARKRIRESIIRSYPDMSRITRAGSELGILTNEMEKKRRIMPLRRLFQSIPNLLLTLKPCLMMSPLSVAYFLEADSYKFDIVIFDEASQIFPQDAIGAIFRANQVIIAGDTKQLPPTSFFAATTGSGGEGYDDDEGYDDEVYDSILEGTTNVLPNRTLLWHYRSKHEHLIAFSNQEIYKNNLVTFPSSNESEPDTGVEFVHVPEGYYEPKPKNYNILEAQRCVQLIKEHIDKHPDRSLGIIAFSEKQQQAIAFEIQRFREKNPEYEDFFAEGKEDEFFVKNLENVQGDERDTIFFSVGYAKTKEQNANGQPMAMRFGPLGVQGGERRLNVAITRAKINVKLVSTILPSDIDLSKTESEGIKMLRAYIEFAMNGEATLSAAHKVNRPDDFADAIAQFIRDHGYKVRQYVGCSGYKIDIAVQHPSETIEQFVAGIECDGYSYVSAKTARDRDRLRSSVLKSMGWSLYRVWSTEWLNNPEIEGQKLLEFIQKAIRDCDVKVKALEEEKRRIEEAKRLEIEKARAAREAVERRKQRELEEKEAKRRAELEAAERKRREEAERKATQLRAEQEATRKREEERKTAHERARKESEERQKRYDLSWVEKGTKVYHKSFGDGWVTGLTRDSVIVRFGASERKFMYPSVFHNGLLTKPAVQENVVQNRPVAKGPDWAKVGAAVTHKTFGEGVIVRLEGDHIDVQFGKETKIFEYPGAFKTGFLSRGQTNVPSTSPVQMEMKEVLSLARNEGGLLEELKAANFTCIDNRITSSIIWVIYSPEKSSIFERIVSKYNVQYTVECRGALATRNVPAWRVMVLMARGKRLGG